MLANPPHRAMQSDDPTSNLPPVQTAEQLRLAEAHARSANWQRWGSYLSERQWGTVREDYSANGSSIHGTTASPFAELPWGRCTKRLGTDGGTLYLHVFDWPQDGKLRVPGLRNEIKKATLLATDEPLETSRNGDETIIALPADPIDMIDTIIALEFAAPLEIVSPSGG